MGIKYKKSDYIGRNGLYRVTGLHLYKKRNAFFFLLFLCISLFFFSGLFLNQQNSEKKLTYTEGMVISKTNIGGQKKDASTSDTIGCQITIEFSLYNGRKIQKEIPLENEFCSHINTGDLLSVLYHYNKWKGSVEIVSYSRMPVKKGSD